MLIIKNFDQLTKISFDQMPKLLENFNQLKMSSEIQSSDCFPRNVITLNNSRSRSRQTVEICQKFMSQQISRSRSRLFRLLGRVETKSRLLDLDRDISIVETNFF